MFEDVSESAFPALLAAFWTEKGWETSVTENDDGTYLVAGDRDSGTRGLIGVRPGDDTEIGASEIEDFAGFCDRKGVEVRVMATRGQFTTGARSAAEAGNIHLLDQNELASSVREAGLEHLIEEYVDDSGDGGGSLLGALPGVPVPSGLASGIPVVPLVAAVVVVAAAVFAAPTVLGAVPFLDGGDDSGGAGVSMTALSLADANSSGNVTTVQWDARVQESVNGGNYTAPEGETFVVVQTNVTASGSAATLRAEHFALSVNGTNRPVQSFADASREFRSTQLPVRVSSGGSTRAVLVFTVPADVDGATLVETYEGPGVRFERADLSFDVE